VTKIAVWSAFGGMATDLPKALPDDEVAVPKDDSELAAAADAECAIGTNNGSRVKKLLDAAPKLRWYHSVGAGVEDLIGVREFRERGIALTNNSGSYDIQIAEHALAFILAAAKRLHVYRDQQTRRNWKDHRQDELRGSTLVVYGIGSIGAEIARLGAALGMRVIGVRRRVEAVEGVERIVPPELLEDVAGEADYLAIAAPLTRATRGAISKDVMARMKKTAWIVNIARGAIVDEDAMVDALRAGRLGGAGLDAFTTEPLPADHPLWTLENVMISPHSSNSSPHVRERTLALFTENLRRFKSGEDLLNRVDFEAGY
jgi:phosphoglycerate dehydrogenase-like enzyme